MDKESLQFYKDMADRVVADVKKSEAYDVVCDKCGSTEITTISYGTSGWIVIDEEYEIDPRILELLKEKRIVLGGCSIKENAPKYFCRKCNNKFGIYK